MARVPKVESIGVLDCFLRLDSQVLKSGNVDCYPKLIWWAGLVKKANEQKINLENYVQKIMRLVPYSAWAAFLASYPADREHVQFWAQQIKKYRD